MHWDGWPKRLSGSGSTRYSRDSSSLAPALKNLIVSLSLVLLNHRAPRCMIEPFAGNHLERALRKAENRASIKADDGRSAVPGAVVGIRASRGGDAFKTFFTAMPLDSGIAMRDRTKRLCP